MLAVMFKNFITGFLPTLVSIYVVNCSTTTPLNQSAVTPPCPKHPVESSAKGLTVSSAISPSAELVPTSPRRVDQTQIALANDPVTAYRDALTSISSRPADYSCSPNLSPALTEVLLQTAEHVIKNAGEHVSPGALDVIIPLLQLAAHSGNQAAQYRYGGYVVGYYLTDEMFWPREKETASDALAMLRIVAADAPTLVGDDKTWILGNFLPTSDKTPFDRVWLRRAKEIEARYRKCRSDRTESKKSQKDASSEPAK
jgi:hypothetical protein